MKEIDEAKVAKTIERMNKLREENGLDKLKEVDGKTVITSIGTNGRQVGQEFTFTGELKLDCKVVDANGKVTSIYEGFGLSDGTYLSVKQFMGLSSLLGYNLSGEFTQTNGTKYEAKTIEDFNFEDCFQPETREYIPFLTWLLENPNFYEKGKTIRYLAFVVRPYEAKKAGEAFGEKWKKGDTRCMTAKLWSKPY